MKIWGCWQTRRWIPHWIRGECSRSEAAAIAAHAGACAACAAEAVLDAALVDAASTRAGASDAAHHEAAWARVEQVLALEAMPPATARGSARTRPLHLSLAAALLVVGLSLAGHWRSQRRQPMVTPASGYPAPPLSLSLWEPEPAVDDPMGPTTERWLILTEGKK